MLVVTITTKQSRRRIQHNSGPLEIGRIASENGKRVVVDDPFLSRKQLQLQELGPNKLRVDNLSANVSVLQENGDVLKPGQQTETALPTRLSIGATFIEVEWTDATAQASGRGPWQTLRAPSMKGSTDSAPGTVLAKLVVNTDELTPETLAHWFEVLISVQRAAAGSSEFYQETASAVVDLIGLDRGMVLLRRADQGDDWEPVASHSSAAAPGVATFSRTILRRVIEEGCTFYRGAETLSQAGSLQGVEAVVASPIYDFDDKVVGAVYGMRLIGKGGNRPDIRPIEAQLVQLLAAATGAGLARIQRESEAARARVQFEQFFSEKLARKLEREPNLLEGRDRIVTVLFSDIRGFSRLSERLNPTSVFRLVGDVMDRLTQCVVESDGMVDYIGDGLLAMWNAPDDQPDHALRACRAAIAMIGQLPAINADWEAELGAPVKLGIGVNSGPARVGNTGSRRRFKYGPLGHAVNLASRVEGATKHWQVPILVTESTQSLVAPQLATRRLGQMRMPGMDTAVNIFELGLSNADEKWQKLRDDYEAGLDHFEAGKWAETCQRITPWASDSGESRDVPSLMLLERAIHCLTSPPESFDPVIHLVSK